MFRQGDVLLIPIDYVPLAATKQPRKGDIVLAHGEVTGHAHRIKELQADVFMGAAGTRFLRAAEPVNLTHEEHATVSIPPGAYRIVQQREWDGADSLAVRD